MQIDRADCILIRRQVVALDEHVYNANQCNPNQVHLAERLRRDVAVPAKQRCVMRTRRSLPRETQVKNGESCAARTMPSKRTN